MEITNEVKAKVFAQYLGQIVKITDRSNTNNGSRYSPLKTDLLNQIILVDQNVNEPERWLSEFLLRPLSAITDEDAIEVYLQSKGYDLPHYLLGGKTLKEAGLAIYEQENK